MVKAAPARTVRWGIAGFGWVARDYVAPALAAVEGARLVAVCDPTADARARARAQGLAETSSLDELLAAHELDALYVCAPNHLHRTLVERAARAGLHVLCEKPTATTLADAQAMFAACERAGVAFATAYDQRYHPAHRHVRDMVAAGELGTVTAVRSVYACWVDANWAADNWRIDRQRSGGGALIDLAPHGFDLIAALLGEEIAEVAAFEQRRVHGYGVDDGAMIVGRTASGVLINMHVAYNCPETLPRRRLEVQGTRGLAIATNTLGQQRGGELEFIGANDGVRIPVAYADRECSPFEALVEAFTHRVLASPSRDAESTAHDLHVMRLLESLVCR